MDHYGQVMEVKGDHKAIVRIRATHSCDNCGRCGGFFGDPEKNRDRLAEVFNPIGASEGQFVRLEARASEMLLAAFMLYLLPLIALLIGLFAGRAAAMAGELTGSADVWGLGTGLFFMVLVFLLLRLQERRLAGSKRFKAVIAAVVNEEDMPDHVRLPAAQ